MSILQDADNLVHNDRRKEYEHPAIFFAKYASILSAFLAEKLTSPITPEEANMSMILFKLIREQGKPKKDNRIDIAGYAETLDMQHQAKAVDISVDTLDH